MSLPTEFDFALIKLGDGGSPSETFTVACGAQDITMNFASNSSDRFVRDCAKPGEVPYRKAKATGRQLDVTASGLTDTTTFGTELDLLGHHVNTKIELYADDGTDAGDLLGTVDCNMLVTGISIGTPRDGDSTAELTLASNGAWTWAAA